MCPHTVGEVAGLVLAVAAAVAILSAEVLDDAGRAAGRRHLRGDPLAVPRCPAQDSALPAAMLRTPSGPETAAAAIFATGTPQGERPQEMAAPPC